MVMPLTVLPSQEYTIAVTHLMTRSKLGWSWKIGPEQRECIRFADAMRQHTLNGDYRGIWIHVPNEGKRHKIVALILTAMGLIAGATDYFFIWQGGAGVIEFKTKGNGLTPYQKYFRTWCERWGISWAKVYSAEEGLGMLKQWGALQ